MVEAVRLKGSKVVCWLCISVAYLAPGRAFAEATLSLKAVAKNGNPLTPTNWVAVSPGDIVTAELFFSGWDNPPFDGGPALAQFYQATLIGESGAESNGGDPNDTSQHVLPVGWDAPITRDPCPCDNPAYPVCHSINGCVGTNHTPSTMGSTNDLRSDYIFFGFDHVKAESFESLDLRWGGLIITFDGQTARRCQGGSNSGGTCQSDPECPSGFCNPNFQSYAGTLNLRVGANICGTTRYTFVPDIDQTLLANTAAVSVSVLPIIENLNLVAETPCPAPACTLDAHCDDSNPCTDDACVSQLCQHTDNAAPCSDGIPCTVNDVCQNGFCTSGSPPDCSQLGSLCMEASCDPNGATGNCDVLTAKPNGTPCDDVSFCNGVEHCMDGECQPGPLPCQGGLGCFEASQSCAPCIAADDCYDRFECTVKACDAGVCIFETMEAPAPLKSRFISLVPPQLLCSAALRVSLISLHHVNPPYTGGPSVPFTSFEGQVRWVGPPAQYIESNANPTPFYAASLQCMPYYQDWGTVGLLHVTGSAITPSSVYEVAIVSASCMGHEANCVAVSASLALSTTRWGDVETPYSPPNPGGQPDFGDVAAMVNKFKSAAGAPIKARVLLAGEDAFGNISANTMNLDLSFTHISACVDAFKGKPYPYSIQSCP